MNSGAEGDKVYAAMPLKIRPRGRPRKGEDSDQYYPKGTKTREVVAKAAGMSFDTLKKLRAIIKATEDFPDEFAELSKQVDAGEISINRAYNIIINQVLRHDNYELQLIARERRQSHLRPHPRSEDEEIEAKGRIGSAPGRMGR